jgi:hypothetical protein
MIIFGIVVQKMGEFKVGPTLLPVVFFQTWHQTAWIVDMGEGENKHIVKRVMRVEQLGKVNQKSTRLPRVNSDQWPA